jgi:hypothetical protein
MDFSDLCEIHDLVTTYGLLRAQLNQELPNVGRQQRRSQPNQRLEHLHLY